MVYDIWSAQEGSTTRWLCYSAHSRTREHTAEAPNVRSLAESVRHHCGSSAGRTDPV